MARAMVILVVAVLAGAAVGCGGDDVARTVDPVAQAADKTVAAGGAQLDGEGEFRAAGVTVPVTVDGAVDFDDRRVHMSMDVPPNDVLRPVQAAEAGFPLEFILDGGETVFFASADMRQQLPPGKHWAKVDFGELDDETGLAFQQLSRYDESNPAEWLRLLRTSGGAERVGAERLNGLRTTRYRATIDPRRIPGTLPEDEREKARETLKEVGRIDPSALDPMPVDVWIDDDGLIRRERVTVDDVYEGVRTRGHLTIDFTEFGRDVSVQEPEDDETLDLTAQLAERLQRP
jgi:hypothetical protein